jgi:hypothetical protein
MLISLFSAFFYKFFSELEQSQNLGLARDIFMGIWPMGYKKPPKMDCVQPFIKFNANLYPRK